MARTVVLTNVHDEDLFGHRLIRLVGRVDPDEDGELILEHEPATAGRDARTWPVRQGWFKAFVLLDQGENRIRLCHRKAETILRLRFDPPPPDWHHRVRLVYLCARDDDGRFVCPPPGHGTRDEAVERLRFVGDLLQCVTAETLAEAGRGPRTFQFVPDPDDPQAPAVDVHVSGLTRAEIHALGRNWGDGGGAGWSHFADELSGYPRRLTTIDVGILAMTERCPPDLDPRPETGFLAHTAMGGGTLALFGGASLGTWAAGLDDLTARFTDDRRCAAFADLHDDSAGRGALWATCSTTAGAVLHELAHCFGLPHAESGIMARGFDDLYRYVLIAEPGSGNVITPDRERGVRWHPDSTERLARSPYLTGPPGRPG
jgi:hypothetical protein